MPTSVNPEQTDEDLYDAWATGDQKAAAALTRRYADRIYRYLSNKVASPDDAQDLIGTTWEKLLRGLGTFEHRSGFRTYLFGIAHNVLRDYIKARTRRAGKQVNLEESSIYEISPTVSVILDERKERQLLYRALPRLPFECQVVIELSYFERMPQPEIAVVLGLPVGTVATRIRRGKRLLREQLEKEANAPGQLESTLGEIDEWMQAVKAQLRELGLPDDDDAG